MSALPSTICIRPMPKSELVAELEAYEPSGWSIGRNATGRSQVIDNTSDEGDRAYIERLHDARTRHRAEMNAMELGDIACDDRLVDAWRKGDTTVLGMVFADLIEERIESTARRAAA